VVVAAGQPNLKLKVQHALASNLKSIKNGAEVYTNTLSKFTDPQPHILVFGSYVLEYLFNAGETAHFNSLKVS